MSYTVYLLECADKTIYTGCTLDIIKRLRQHNKGNAGAKYTRARRPVTLVYSEVLSNIARARKREANIKRLSRAKKIELIKNIPKN